MFNSLKGMSTHLPALQYFVFNFASTVLILVAGWMLSSLAGRAVKRMAARSTHVDPTVVPMVESITIWAIRIVVLIAVLARLGVQTASVVAVLGAAGLAIGLALQGTLQNIAAGIMLLALRPLRAGEYVSIVGKGEGTVEEVGLFLTRLLQSDGVFVSLPNSSVWGSTIINYSRNATRRLEFEVDVSPADKVDTSVAALRNEITAIDGIRDTPAPRVEVSGYKGDTAVLTITVWSDSVSYWDLRMTVHRRVMAALTGLGMAVPAPLRDVNNPGPVRH